jgi:integrase/recombinase XerD
MQNKQINPVERFFNYITVEKGLSENTVEAYRNDIENFQKYLIKNKKNIVKFDRNDIIGYLSTLRDSGKQNTTIARNISSIRGLCRFMLFEGIIKEDPVENLGTPKGWKRLPKTLGIDDVLKLIEKPHGKKFSLRDRAILELMYSSGLRVSEVINLKLDDINFEAGFITVTGKGSKERVVPVNERTISTIKKYINKQRPSLLGKRNKKNLIVSKGGRVMTRQRLWQLIKYYSKGIARDITPHTLRHCFASHLLDRGADLRTIQKMLGHADISTTEIYTKVTSEKLRKIHKDYHPRG